MGGFQKLQPLERSVKFSVVPSSIQRLSVQQAGSTAPRRLWLGALDLRLTKSIRGLGKSSNPFKADKIDALMVPLKGATFLVHGLLPVRVGTKTTSSPGLTVLVDASCEHVTDTLDRVNAKDRQAHWCRRGSSGTRHILSRTSYAVSQWMTSLVGLHATPPP